MNRAVIKMAGLKVRRSKATVLDIGDLTINQGELVSLIGPNGAGKSTLLQTINLLLPFDEGEFSLFENRVTEQKGLLSLRRRCAMVFQEPLFIKDTVFNNVALPLKFRSLPAKLIKETVEKSLSAFHCDHLADRFAYHLSGGEAQRVCLARSFVSDPEILLLDEPFTALDPSTRRSLLIELKQEVEQRNMTVVMVSHLLNDILRFTNRTIVMEAGAIVQDDAPATVLRRPASLAVARLVGMDNMIPCTIEESVQGTEIRLTDQVRFQWNKQPGEISGFCCLPGDVFRIAHEAEKLDSSWVVLEGTIKQIIPGIGTYQTVLESQGLQINLRLPKEKAINLRLGDSLKVAFHSSDAHII